MLLRSAPDRNHADFRGDSAFCTEPNRGTDNWLIRYILLTSSASRAVLPHEKGACELLRARTSFLASEAVGRPRSVSAARSFLSLVSFLWHASFPTLLGAMDLYLHPHQAGNSAAYLPYDLAGTPAQFAPMTGHPTPHRNRQPPPGVFAPERPTKQEQEKIAAQPSDHFPVRDLPSPSSHPANSYLLCSSSTPHRQRGMRPFTKRFSITFTRRMSMCVPARTYFASFPSFLTPHCYSFAL